MTQNEIVFIDTSAFYALMDGSDEFHEMAKQIMETLLKNDVSLTTSNYIIIEVMALLQSRLGFEAADVFYEDILQLVSLLWIDQSTHEIAVELWRGLGRKKVSLVDCVSFMTMRQTKIHKTFSFDKHFSEQGFEILK